jgi:mono/diheme cytochrome c family protein
MKELFNFKPVLRIAAMVFLTQSALANNDSGEISETEYYRVVGDKVDAETFVGYNVYHNVCVGCHGVGGDGSELAPNLTESLEYLNPTQFKIKVLHKFAVKFSKDEWIDMQQAMFEEIRKQENRDHGDLANMPSWQNNPMVSQNIQNIYRYLKARADGVLGPEKPALLNN